MKKESSILKEKADLQAKFNEDTKIQQSLKAEIEKLTNKVNEKDDMLTKESELATLQSNLTLQSKDLIDEKVSLEKKIKTLEDEKTSWKEETENSSNSML